MSYQLNSKNHRMKGQINRENNSILSDCPTYLFHAIDIAKNKIKYDTEVKRILSDKSILAWILKYTVTELQSLTIPEIITCIEGEPEIMTVPIYPGSTPLSPDSSSLSAITGTKNEDAVPNEGKIAYECDPSLSKNFFWKTNQTYFKYRSSKKLLSWI